MNFQLVFENSGDSIPFTVVANHDLFEFFVDKLNAESTNSFFNDGAVVEQFDRLSSIQEADIIAVNKVLPSLIGQTFPKPETLEGYLNQDFFLDVHCRWVHTQDAIIDIDELRFSSDPEQAELGSILHEQYPDEIRKIRLAEVLIKLGLIESYERINLRSHWMENILRHNMVFDNVDKYRIFENPFMKNLVTSNGVTNFNFAYTYLGRKYYDQFICFNDTDKYDDDYNFQRLEYSFNLTMARPQTLPFSPEFLEWCQQRDVKPVGEQIPIGNIKDLSYNNVFEYSKVLVRNLRQKNSLAIHIN